MKFNHKKFEKNSILFLIATIVVISIGGLVEIVPLFRMETTIEPVKGVRPYTPLELAGFNIYLSEGCYNCHSQQIRPLRDEVERYGHYSLDAESMYDYPFKVGDLVKVRSSITRDVSFQKDGIIIAINEDTKMYEVLVENVIRKLHKSYLIVPKIKAVQFNGGIK